MEIDGHTSSRGRPQVDPAVLEKELDEKYPNRPHNHFQTLPFHVLFEDLFNPLNANKKSKGPAANRKRRGPHAGLSANPQEVRRAIIERFISRWRREVGDDIYPAFRLIIPEKDRERAMYGLKEKALGKFLVKIMKIDKNSEDGFNLLNWKIPGQSTATKMVGDFAGRCFEVISKRPILTDVGDMTIEEVNDLLDQLSAAPREENQLPIMDQFYRRMNAEELMWLIRVILRTMHVGATERTFFSLWHPDAESLFNVSSSLRRVCWELHDPSIRLEGEDRGVNIMQCFQPQLAQFQMHSFQRMVEKMQPTEEDQTFWIEEKLDGERMQLHMTSDDSVAGGKKFGFWSRKAKDYAYLYGSGFQDENSALTRHLKPGFADGVENIILDGEMITWDPEQDVPVAFGTLKTAALSEQRNPFANGQRPLFRIFDILYLNDQPLTRYTLRDRRHALERSVIPIHRRFEIHQYREATKAEEIEPLLREVVAQASEGLVIKNPRSAYRLNERNDDWMKVKPEYMTEFGEKLDCIVIGGYYGSGKRGGALSSFLCGLRVDETFARKGDPNQMKFESFFKVGGGFTAADYANVRHHTEGKWIDWDPKNPPTQFVKLGGGPLQYERPDVWIKPSDSLVVEVRAASVGQSDQFGCGLTLRFPRFKKLRMDKTWESALSIQEFLDLKNNVEKEHKEKEFKVDDARRKRTAVSRKKPLTVAGYNTRDLNEAKFEGPSGKVFEGLTFFIMTESSKPMKKTKIELEEMAKANGGNVVQTHDAVENTVCVAERRTVKVASLQKRGQHNLIRPTWLFDCIAQSKTDSAKGLSDITVPFEVDRHLFFGVSGKQEEFQENVDEYGDSYARDTSLEELKMLMDKMGRVESLIPASLALRLKRSGDAETPGWMFTGLLVYFDPVNGGSPQLNGDKQDTAEGPDYEYLQKRQDTVCTTVRFGGALTSDNLANEQLTHVVVHEKSNLKHIRKVLSSRQRLPRIVTRLWIEKSWKEKTLLDEEKFAPT